jgi:hypothetical protein
LAGSAVDFLDPDPVGDPVGRVLDRSDGETYGTRASRSTHSNRA